MGQRSLEGSRQSFDDRNVSRRRRARPHRTIVGSVVGMDRGMYRTCVRQRRVARGVDDNTDRRARPRDPRVTRSFDERRGVPRIDRSHGFGNARNGIPRVRQSHPRTYLTNARTQRRLHVRPHDLTPPPCLTLFVVGIVTRRTRILRTRPTRPRTLSLPRTQRRRRYKESSPDDDDDKFLW